MTAQTRDQSIRRRLSDLGYSASSEPTGVIEGYASLFNVTDSGGDVVIQGAFARSLKKRGVRGVKMLWQHQPREPIGSWLSLVENARGLKVTGQLDLSVQRGRETLSLIRSGAVDGLSIGFRTVLSDTSDSSGVRRLQEVDLWEISVVTFPMLEKARITDLKHRTRDDAKTFRSISLDQIRNIAWRHAASRLDAGFRLCHMQNISQ